MSLNILFDIEGLIVVHGHIAGVVVGILLDNGVVGDTGLIVQLCQEAAEVVVLATGEAFLVGNAEVNHVFLNDSSIVTRYVLAILLSGLQSNNRDLLIGGGLTRNVNFDFQDAVLEVGKCCSDIKVFAGRSATCYYIFIVSLDNKGQVL